MCGHIECVPLVGVSVLKNILGIPVEKVSLEECGLGFCLLMVRVSKPQIVSLWGDHFNHVSYLSSYYRVSGKTFSSNLVC